MSYLISDFQKRRLKSSFMQLLCVLLALIAILPLLSIFFYVLHKGLQGINFEFFLNLPKPAGEVGGGMGNAILGSLKMVGIASLIGVPWGIFCGIYFSEYGRGKFAEVARLTADLLASTPSIVIGIFAYATIVMAAGGFSAFAGAAALSIIMLPTIARATEEVMKRVSEPVREAGLALGLPRWRVILQITLRTCLSGILTAILLSVARISGETAPLLFTALGSQYWTSLHEPTASLPVQIYTFAISPFDDWHEQAWGGALVLISFVFLLNLLTRFFFARQISFQGK